MRVLFANDICGYFGGVEQVIVDTARGLAERGHTSCLAYHHEARDVAKFTAPFEACYQCSELAPEGGADGQPFSAILASARPDVIYFHKVTRLPPHGDFVHKIRAVRMVHDHALYCPTSHKYFRHGMSVCHHAAGFRCWLDLAFLAPKPSSPTGLALVSIPGALREMRQSHALDALLAVSSFVRDGLLMNGFPAEKVHVVHPILPLDDPPFTPVPDEPRILFVGQLIRGKGLDLLLQALARVGSPFSLTVVGTGNAREKLHAMCAQGGLASKVRFLDWVDHDAIGRHYLEAKVVAAPSRWPEPFTLVGQEAMRHGRPIVAFDVGGNRDWLEHERTGLLVPEQDIAGYAAALTRLLGDTAYANRLGANAYGRVRERFSFAGYLDHVEAALRGPGSARHEGDVSSCSR